MQTGAFGATPPARYPDFFTPGGRLTLQSGTPVMSTDQASKTIVYYTHDQHAYFPVVKNGIVKPVYFPDELSLTLTSAHSANAIFDVFGIEQNGRGRIVTGPAWTTATAGSGSRGTGGGSTEHSRACGLLVNKWGIPGLSAEGSTFIPPLEGTYLGSLSIDSSDGQVTCHTSYGQNRKWGLWNAYNQRPIRLRAGASADQTYTSQTSITTRPAHNDSNNKLTTFIGVVDGPVTCRFEQCIDLQCQSFALTVSIGVGANSTSSMSGRTGRARIASIVACEQTVTAEYVGAPALGINNFTALETLTATGTNTAIFRGGESQMCLSAAYRG